MKNEMMASKVIGMDSTQEAPGQEKAPEGPAAMLNSKVATKKKKKIKSIQDLRDAAKAYKK